MKRIDIINDLLSTFEQKFQTFVNELPIYKREIVILSQLRKEVRTASSVSLIKQIKEELKKELGERVINFQRTLKLLNKYIGISEAEKKLFGEVLTPFELIKSMLDTLPKEIWKNPNIKIADIANGTGNFILIAVQKFMIGLKEWEPNEKKRFKHIIENQVYVSELSTKNMFVYLQLFDPRNEYKLNFFRGNTLSKDFDKHMKKEWKVENFDVIVGNFPYQLQKPGFKKTQPLWNIFVEKSISILSENGYLCTVHPSGWRSLDGDYKDVQNLLKGNLIHLEMNDDKVGQLVFGATTSFDWYCYSKNPVKSTKIKDQSGNLFEINLSNWEFIPNGSFDVFEKLICENGKEKVEVLYSRSGYGTDKSHMSKEKNDEFKYPCVYTIIKNKTINLYWSNTNKNGYFGVPKVMWSNGMASPATIDRSGEYGLTQFAYAIVDNEKNLDNIKKCMDSEKFINLMKLCYMSSGNRFDRKVLSTFKKDFWKEFI